MKYILDEKEFGKLQDEIHYFKLLDSIHKISEELISNICHLESKKYCDNCVLIGMKIKRKDGTFDFCRRTKHVHK